MPTIHWTENTERFLFFNARTGDIFWIALPACHAIHQPYVRKIFRTCTNRKYLIDFLNSVFLHWSIGMWINHDLLSICIEHSYTLKNKYRKNRFIFRKKEEFWNEFEFYYLLVFKIYEYKVHYSCSLLKLAYGTSFPIKMLNIE